MIIAPIIPLWLMIIITIILIVLTFLDKKFNLVQILIIILLFIINLRIMYPSDSVQVLANNLDVLFVIDNTISMNAEDYDGNNTRLSALKNDTKYIIQELNGARFSVITFNNTAKIVTPFTKDANMSIEAIEIMDVLNETYAKGSSLDIPVETMEESLKNRSNNKDKICIVFFISDGENTSEKEINGFQNLAKYIDEGAVLGYGTTKGGYMKARNDASENEEYIMDNTNYEKAVSKIDENNLKNIAKDLKIDYIYMNKQNNINSKIKEIKKMMSTGLEKGEKSSYNDTYYFLIPPVLILILFEFNKFRRQIL